MELNQIKAFEKQSDKAEAEVAFIRPEEAKELLARTDVLFLDVREPNEVAASGNVSGAQSVPRGLIEFRADPNSALHDAQLNRAKTVIVYCGSGGRAALAAKTLKEMGFSDVRHMGGFQGMGRCGRRDRKRMTVAEDLKRYRVYPMIAKRQGHQLQRCNASSGVHEQNSSD
jgi:rhodanese-related sulfurtransferase